MGWATATTGTAVAKAPVTMTFPSGLKTKLVGGALLASIGCGPATPVEPVLGEEARSDKARITSAPPPGVLETTVGGLNSFALSLHRALAKPGENLAFSPTSISGALGMTYAGAAGNTAKAFESTLRITTPAAEFHRGMNALDAALTSRGQGASGKDGKPFKLTNVNQTFAQKGYALLPAYLDTLAQEYGAGVKLVDFIGETEKTRVGINGFVAFHTEQLIKNLIPEGALTADARLVLVNAIYFNAAWVSKFDKNVTRDAPFATPTGTKQVPTMSSSSLAARAATLGGVEAVELAYSGDELGLLLLVPPAGDFARYSQSLDRALLEATVAALRPETLELSMPKFKVATARSLREPLSALGLGEAFSDSADLSGINGKRDLKILEVVHQAFVNTDEDGTEAAAATGVIAGTTSLPMNRSVRIDRPFLYAIRDRATGAIVFMGQVVNP